MVKSYGLKVIQSGNVIEVYEYKNPVLQGYSDKRKTVKGRQAVANEEDKETNRDKVLQRARKNVRRIINANIQKHSKFLTLTFKENIQDIPQANKEFMLFIKRLSYHLGYKVQYTAVVEFQERGAIHFHVLLYNVLEKLDLNWLSQIWSNGFINLKSIKDVDNVGAYVCKYMTKCEDEVKLRGKKMYFNSRGLNKPVEIKEPELVRPLVESLQVETPKYSNTFENDYNSINYKQYIIKDYKDKL